MIDYATLEYIPGTQKKIRVYWDDGEKLGPSDHRPWHMDSYIMKGIGEDGSTWEQHGDYDENTEDWYPEDDAELIEKAGHTKEITVQNWKNKYPGYWDAWGKSPVQSSLLTDRFMKLSVKEFFDLKYGKFPSVNHKEGVMYKDLQDELKDPNKFHQRLIGVLPYTELVEIELDKEVEKYKRVWDKEKQKDIIIATDYGIVYDILNTNSSNLLRKLDYNKKNKNGNTKWEIMKGIVKYLL